MSQRAHDYLGPLGTQSLRILVISSALASALGLFNNSIRYVYALARVGVLPTFLSRTHPRFHSPHVAGVVIGALCLLTLLVAGLAGLDPLKNLSPMFIGLASLGLMSLLALSSLGIPLLFARRKEFAPGKTIAPFIGGIGISACAGLAAMNYEVLTGVESRLINSLPLLLVLIVIAGMCQTLWLRACRLPDYRRIGASRVEE